MDEEGYDVSDMRRRAIEGLKIGDSFTTVRTFTREETERFGRLTRDYNPVHYDERWTESKGFDGLICHGLLIGSMICEAGGQVGWLAGGMNFRFVAPVYFGDTITCVLTITDIRADGRAHAVAEMTDQRGREVIRAELTGRLPLDGEREIMARMRAEGDPTNGLHRPEEADKQKT